MKKIVLLLAMIVVVGGCKKEKQVEYTQFDLQNPIEYIQSTYYLPGMGDDYEVTEAYEYYRFWNYEDAGTHKFEARLYWKERSFNPNFNEYWETIMDIPLSGTYYIKNDSIYTYSEKYKDIKFCIKDNNTISGGFFSFLKEGIFKRK